MSKGEFNGVEFGASDAENAASAVETHGAFDCAAGVHWFAANYHGGQDSALYAVLSGSEYRPGASERRAPDGGAETVYETLVFTAGGSMADAERLAAAILAAITEGHDYDE